MNEVSESPAVVLRQAAARVRETARGATEGPWVVHEAIGGFLRVQRPEGLPAGRHAAHEGADLHEDNRDTANWIALAHPGLGEPLAAWLEETADLHEQNTLPGPNDTIPSGCQWCADEDWPCADTRRALAVARIILGTKETIDA